MSFLGYALAQLPPPPARVLEVGCGPAGGLASALTAAGYDVLAIDPQAPEGPPFRRTTIEELDEPGPFGAVVAGRVLHHVDPLGPALDKLAGLASLLIVDDFGCERVDAAARAWHRERFASLTSPRGPSDLDEWANAHLGLHPSTVLLPELEARYEPRHLEWRPYLYRWLGDEETKALEEQAIESGLFEPIGFRFTGRVRSRRSDPS